MIKTLVNNQGLVVNVIAWDPATSPGYTPSTGLTIHDDGEGAQIGATLNPDSTYTPPPQPDEPDDGDGDGGTDGDGGA